MPDSLLTIAQLKAEVQTGLAPASLQVIIDREEATMIERIGAHPDGATAVTELHAVDPGIANVYTNLPIVSVSSIEERQPGGTPATVSSSSYEVWSGEGRIERHSGSWRARVSVTYIPRDQRPRRIQALINLIRIILDRTALQAESVAGEYSYTAGDFELERARIYRSLGYPEV